MTSARSTELAERFCRFVDASPSPFHAVAEACAILKGAGYEHLSEAAPKPWALRPGGRYFFTRNASTVFAFAVGGAYDPARASMQVVAAHTDSPCFKLKPISRKHKSGYLAVGVQLYGGGQWHTWFDRDLTVAGRVIVRGPDGALQHRLVHVRRPIMRIPTLAIHLNRGVIADGFKINTQTHTEPIMATAAIAAAVADAAAAPAAAAPGQKRARTGKGKAAAVASAAPAQEASSSSSSSGGDAAAAAAAAAVHDPVLLDVLAGELGVDADAIADFELCVADTQPSAIGGVFGEFIFAPRLDNLFSSFTALEALVAADETLAADAGIRVIALYDNEEIGSVSAQGASSNMTEQVLRRILAALPGPPPNADATLRRSYLVSADMAHALHPNYAEKHDSEHQPALHRGPVIKHNANLRYATTAVSAALLREVARRAGVPLQDFVVRNDSACGSTIGPSLSARCGIRTVDIGVAQLSMHSIREMTGVEDIASSVDLFKTLWSDFADVDASLAGVDDTA